MTAIDTTTSSTKPFSASKTARRTARCAIKSAARTEGEGRTACKIIGDSALAIIAGQFCHMFRFLSFACLKLHFERPSGGQILRKKSHNIRFSHILGIYHPPIFPPRAPRSPPGHPLKRTKSILESIQILIIFCHRFLIDFGSFWSAILGSFSAFWRPSWASKCDML